MQLGATVRVRQDGSLGSLGVWIWIDGVKAGKLSLRNDVVVPTAAGAHEIQARWSSGLRLLSSGEKNSEILDFTVNPREQIRFDCRSESVDSSKRLVLSPRPFTPVQGSAPPLTLPPDARVLGTWEAGEYAEPLGNEIHQIDNRASSATVAHGLRVSREWTRTLTVGANQATTRHGEAGLNFLWLSAKASIEAELQHTYSLAIGATHLFEQTLTVNLRAHEAVRVIVTWSRTWRCGQAQILMPDGSVHMVPFQVVSGVSFNPRIENIAGP